MPRLANSRFALSVHALTLLAHADPARKSSKDMALSARANPVHLRKVLGKLREAGLVESKVGQTGGWTLAVDPEHATLGDVWRIVNDDEPVLSLRGSDPGCRVGRTVQQAMVDADREIRETILAELDATTLAELTARVPA